MSKTIAQLRKEVAREVKTAAVIAAKNGEKFSVEKFARAEYGMPGVTMCDFLAGRIPHLPIQILNKKHLEKRIVVPAKPAKIVYEERK